MDVCQKELYVKDFFRISLDLKEPWKLIGFEFNEQEQQWNLFVDYQRGTVFLCPLCEQQCKADNAFNRTWRYRDLLQWKTYIHAFLPHFYCESCKMNKVLMVPEWARSKNRFN
jgi:transposase